jgi:SAM-dependent methyltransferase
MFKKLLHKEKFNPGFIGIFINPFFFARKALFNGIKKHASHIEGNILDVGCGKKPYKNLFNYKSYIGLDIENEGHDHTNEDIDVYYDGNKFPFSDKQFESIIANQVFEHVFNPNDFLKECYRVLKNDGKLLLTVPFVWDEHEQPYDFGRYSSFGIISILKEHNFEVLCHDKTLNDFRCVIELLILYIYKITRVKNKYLNYITSVILISPLNILGLLLYKLFPKNNDLFIDNIILCKKITTYDRI